MRADETQPNAQEEQFCEGVAHLLEQPPPVQIPGDFAGRVAALAVTQRPRRAGLLTVWERAGFGPTLALVGCVLLAIALFVCARYATPSFRDLRFDLELMLLAELGGVCWVGARFGLME